MTTTWIAASEAKAKFSELLDRAQKGESFSITLHGEEAAHLTQVLRAKAGQSQVFEMSAIQFLARAIAGRVTCDLLPKGFPGRKGVFFKDFRTLTSGGVGASAKPQPGAAPNGGSAERLGDSRAAEGPPSVS